MARPGVEIVQTDIPPPRSVPTDTGVWFVVGVTQKGVQEPIFCGSLAQFESKCGGRLTTSFLYDAVETYFREGGSRIVVGRAIGPAAVRASRALNDNAATQTLLVTAREYGADGNLFTVQVTQPVGGTYNLTIRYNGTIVEQTPDFTTDQQAVDWSETSDYVTITQAGASALIPAVLAATALTGGADDAVNVSTTQITTALAMLSADLGPGQVSAPGYTSTAVHQAVMAHAATRGRVALVDSVDTQTQATVTAQVATDRAAEPRFAGTFWPWLKAPGLTATTLRTVPPTALAAARAADTDGRTGNPNLPAAGINRGRARWVAALSQDPTLNDTEAMNDAGVNVIKMLQGAVTIYGWRTMVNELTDPGWVDLGNSRLNMAIRAACNNIAEQYVFEEIDGNGVLFGRLNGALAGEMKEFFTLGALYGRSEEDAFLVDTGNTVNTPDTIADHQLRAVVAYRPSPMAELVHIEIVKTASSGSVS